VNYDKALNALVSWATTEDNVRALIMTGSAAAGDEHSLSDRDIEIYAVEPDRLLADDSWWASLGEVLVVERLPNPDWHPTRLVYYVGGKFDFTVAPTDALLSAVYTRPFKVLLDKDERATGLAVARVQHSAATAEEFDQCIQWAYAAALMCAKSAVRRELWMAKVRDGSLKSELLRMVEWDHRARYGNDYDTRYLGTRMSAWMDADIQEELRQCWGRFDATDTARALMATVQLFARLSERTAQRWSLGKFYHARVISEGQAQPVEAFVSTSSVNISEGFFQAWILRGRSLISAATIAR
jgi:aminoglycoside 6-adenylyltransferase